MAGAPPGRRDGHRWSGRSPAAACARSQRPPRDDRRSGAHAASRPACCRGRADRIVSRGLTAPMVRVSSRRAAYVVLALLTLVWGFNWILMKAALLHADPLAFNVQRTWLAVTALFVARVDRIWPNSWRAVLVTAFFQTTINFGATTMAVAGGGAGRASVLVFTMPFWTLLIAWLILHERVRARQTAAIAFAFVGLILLVSPWSWHGDVTPKLWAVLSGLAWAAGTVAMK